MNTIRFSHDYPKLYGQRLARLASIEVVRRETLSYDLVDYDTRYYTHDEAGAHLMHYELPSGSLILLVFIGEKMIPFTTIRPFTVGKLRYYTDCINHQFKLEVNE